MYAVSEKLFFRDITTKNFGFSIVESILYTQHIFSPLISLILTTLEDKILICSLKLQIILQLRRLVIKNL